MQYGLNFMHFFPSWLPVYRLSFQVVVVVGPLGSAWKKGQTFAFQGTMYLLQAILCVSFLRSEI